MTERERALESELKKVQSDLAEVVDEALHTEKQLNALQAQAYPQEKYERAIEALTVYNLQLEKSLFETNQERQRLKSELQRATGSAGQQDAMFPRGLYEELSTARTAKDKAMADIAEFRGSARPNSPTVNIAVTAGGGADELRKQMEGLRIENDNVKARANELASSRAELQRALDTLREEHNKVVAEKQQLEQTAKLLQHDQKGYIQTIEGFDGQFMDALQKLQKIQHENTTLFAEKERIPVLERQLEDVQKENGSLANQVKNLEGRCDQLAKEKAQQQQEYVHLQKVMTSSSGALDVKSTELNMLRNQVKDFERELRAALDAKRLLERQNLEYEAQIRALEGRLAIVERELTSSAITNTTIPSSPHPDAHPDSSVYVLRQKISHLETRVSSVTRERDELLRQVRALESERDTLRTRVREGEDQIMKGNPDAAAVASNLRAEMSTLRREIHNEQTRWQTTIQDLEHQLADTRQKLHEESVQAKRSLDNEARAHENEAKRVELQQHVLVLTSDRDNIRHERDQLRVSYNDLSERVRILDAELYNYRSRESTHSAQQNESIDKLREELSLITNLREEDLKKYNELIQRLVMEVSQAQMRADDGQPVSAPGEMSIGQGSDLSKQVRELQHQFKVANEALRKAHDENQATQAKLRETEEKIAEYDRLKREIEAADKQIAALTQRCDELDRTARESEARGMEYQQRLAEKDEEISNLKDELGDNRSRSEFERTRRDSEVGEVRKALTDERQKIQQLQQEITRLNEVIEKTNDQLIESQEFVRRSEEGRIRLEQHQEQVAANLEDERRKSVAAVSESQGHAREAQDLAKQNGTLQQLLHSEREKRSQAEKKLEDMITRYSTIDGTLEDAKTKMLRAERQRDEKIAHTSSLEEMVSSLKIELANAETRIKYLEEQHQTDTMSNISEHNRAQAQADQLAIILEAEKERFSATVSGLTNELAEIHNRNMELEKERLRLQQQLSKSLEGKDPEGLQIEVDSMVKSLSEEVLQLRERNQSLSQSNEFLQKELTFYTQSLNDRRKEVGGLQDLRGRVEENVRRRDRVESEIDAVQNELGAVRSSLTFWLESVQLLDRAEAAAKGEKDIETALSTEIQQLQGQLLDANMQLRLQIESNKSLKQDIAEKDADFLRLKRTVENLEWAVKEAQKKEQDVIQQRNRAELELLKRDEEIENLKTANTTVGTMADSAEQVRDLKQHLRQAVEDRNRAETELNSMRQQNLQLQYSTANVNITS